jgi:hypothetical protein
MLYLASYRVYRPRKRGEAAQKLEGRVLGFACAPNSAVGLQRWCRWLPAGTWSQAFRKLWEELGEAVPVLKQS